MWRKWTIGKKQQIIFHIRISAGKTATSNRYLTRRMTLNEKDEVFMLLGPSKALLEDDA